MIELIDSSFHLQISWINKAKDFSPEKKCLGSSFWTYERKKCALISFIINRIDSRVKVERKLFPRVFESILKKANTKKISQSKCKVCGEKRFFRKNSFFQRVSRRRFFSHFQWGNQKTDKKYDHSLLNFQK